MKNKFDLYYIKDDYLQYLYHLDTKVLQNHDRNCPYIGIITTFDNIDYFIPLSSYKEKHNKQSIFYVPLENKVRKIAIVSLINMIPAYSDVIEKVNLSELKQKDKKYWDLVNEELDLINKEKIYNKIIKNLKIIEKQIKKENKNILKICCNWKLLEEKHKEYQKESSIKK